MAVRKSSWLDVHAKRAVELLQNRYNLRISEDGAREALSAYLNRLTEHNQIGRQPAKKSLTDNVISDVVDELAREVEQQRREIGDTG